MKKRGQSITSSRWRHNGRYSVSNHQPHGRLLNRLFRRRSKKTSKLRVTGLCAGNSPGTGEFPAQIASFPILFADDTNIFITGKSIEEMCTKMNDELEKIQGWLNCNKLSLNVLKTHYMLFAPRNKCINDADIRINNISIQRVYVTKFLGVLIDSKLNWKNHIDSWWRHQMETFSA